MAGLPSLGDIMLLSQLAWKIGCAFTSGRQGAPAEFQEIENELTSLTKAITLLTEVLDRDDSILARADERTKDGLDKILECCRQTLENLNALVEQYQEVRKPEGTGSIAVQRVWKQIFIRNYKKIWWTTEGGNIQALRNMLSMHVNSISLTMQALQSKSLTRLENTIEPMADKVSGIHGKLNGDLDVKIAEIHDLMRNIAVDDAPQPRRERKESLALPESWSQDIKQGGTGFSKNSSFNPDHIDLDQYNFPPTPGGRSPVLQPNEISQRSSKASSREGTGRDKDGRPRLPSMSPMLSGSEFSLRSSKDGPSRDMVGWRGPSPGEPPSRLPSGSLSPELRGSEFPPRSSKEKMGREKEAMWGNNSAERPRMPSGYEPPSRYENDWRANAPAESDMPRLRPKNPYVSVAAQNESTPPSTSHTSPVPSFAMSQVTSAYATPATSHSPSVGTFPAAPSHGVLQSTFSFPAPLAPFSPATAYLPATSSDTPQIPPRSSQRPPLTAISSYTQSRPANGVAPARRVSTATSASYPLSDTSGRISQSSSYYDVATLPSMLPSPVIPPFPEAQPLHSNSLITPFPPVQENPTLEQQSPVTSATDEQQDLFEHELSLDSAILCEAAATLVEYTAPDPETPGQLKMVEVATACKISVITKMRKYATGSHFETSIWTVSNDKKVRLQQKLPDGSQIVPYTIWGNDLKVVLRTETELKFHDVAYNSRPLQVVKTSWVNYVFSDETGSAHFQSVLMGKTLILTLKTKRTLRVHDGLTGTFAFQEQLCGLENIRLWQNDDGDVLAMIHYSSQFRDGYLAFHVGFSSRKRIYFRGDGERHVKIKGLDVPLDKKADVQKESSSDGGKSPKEKPEKEKKITAVRIEFTTEIDKRTFLNRLKEVQG